MKFSIVTTMFRSAPHLREFYHRMARSVQALSCDYEMVFVNDGSPDNSLDVALDLQKIDPRIRVIDLSRNFGHHKAVMAGLSFARGDYVFLIDCDLEEDPENLGMFYETINREADCDVVYGVQPRRKGSMTSRITATLFYRVLNFLSNEEMDSQMVFSRLMSRRYVDSLLQFKESELFLVGLWKITGYHQKPITITTHNKGASSYTLGKKIALAVNGVTSFSNKPLIFISYLGGLISFGSLLAVLYLLFMKLWFNLVLPGWTSVMISVWLIGGLSIFSMGVIGIYIAKMFIEIKHRPYVIVRRDYRDNRLENEANPKELR
jgi:putative glycosyltransferase